MRRYVIVGSGPAGIAAIEAIRSQDAQGEIILITEDPHGFYSRPGLAYYLSKEIPESGLFPVTKQDLAQLNIRWVNGRAERIHAEPHRLSLQGDRSVSYDRLLIATGSRAVRMSVPGIDLEGSIKLDNLEDARKIIKLARRGKKAVVVGGGITALEIVEGLCARGMQVHYFLREDRYWSAVLEKSESKIIQERLHEDGVRIHDYTEMVEILEKRGKVAGVRTKKGETIPCDLVAVAIGVRPQLELARASGIQTDRGILVDEHMQTQVADIFAAGDVGQVVDPQTGKSSLDTLWSPARNQGTHAGWNMAGQIVAIRKQISFNVTRLAGLTTTIIGTVGTGARDEDMVGVSRGSSEAWRETSLPGEQELIAAQSEFEVNHLRLVIGGSQLAGALIMGDQTLSMILQKLIVQRANIDPIRKQLLQPGQSLSEILSNFYNQWQSQYASEPIPQ